MLKIYLKLLQKYQPSAGWTLAELMIAAAMTLVVVMVAGFGLVTILKENKVANATGEMQYDLNRATEFISEEIRSAKTIETNLDSDYLDLIAPNVLEKLDGKTPILALKIDGLEERVIYYVDEVGDDIWRGPLVLKRLGPDFNEKGEHKEDLKLDPGSWRGLPLIDMIVEDLNDEQKQCQNLPFDPAESDGINTYIATDDEGNKWYRQPQATADVKGFFVCVREDKQLAQVNVLGTSLDEFQHLGYDKDQIVNKKSRHSDKMEYTVATMAHARSDIIGSAGEDVPRYRLTNGGEVFFEEEGEATIKVLYVNIPCEDGFDPTNTSSEVRTNFYFDDGGIGGSLGTVYGVGEGSSVTFTGKDNADKATAHMKELKPCTGSFPVQITAKSTDKVKVATNDNRKHTKLNDIIPNPSSTIVNTLTQEGLIKVASDGSYDFTLADNIVLYFVEFAFIIDDPFVDIDQADPPHFDDAIYLVEVTK